MKLAKDIYAARVRRLETAIREVAFLGSRDVNERDYIMREYKEARKALDDLFSRLIELRTRSATE